MEIIIWILAIIILIQSVTIFIYIKLLYAYIKPIKDKDIQNQIQRLEKSRKKLSTAVTNATPK